MRGSDERSGSLFSYVDLEARVRGDHPLRTIREIANAALNDLSREFAALYTDFGRPSIAPEKLLRAMLLQAFYGIRSERQLMERVEFDLLFRWFVGLGVDDPVWDHSTSSPQGRRTILLALGPRLHRSNHSTTDSGFDGDRWPARCAEPCGRKASSARALDPGRLQRHRVSRGCGAFQEIGPR